ncbi:glycoside hydrolase family 71 protein [Laccaria amethystina LaAM-08-1]|uniref:Glycoside hydrolase family 71 protein n=1 Tax=Laccaria amethystina LaAM-08-1 TaxID=1095629 RepID=A0A0C9WK30_9AGAR|nr:glycoside hydrolase family 71 protein [Laccaria amethystina LaAM-08-1]
MSSNPGITAQDTRLLKAYYAPFAKNPHMLKHPRTGEVVVSTFSGENSTSGQGTMENGWAYAKAALDVIALVYTYTSSLRYP